MVVSDERMEIALKRLARSDALVAELHAKTERAEFSAKATKDTIFLREEGSVSDRQAKAGTSLEYAAAMQHYFDALQAYETCKNERSKEVLCIDVWRSENSTRNKGLIT